LLVVAASTASAKAPAGRPSAPQATAGLVDDGADLVGLGGAEGAAAAGGAEHWASRRSVLRASKKTSSFSHSMVFLQRMMSSEFAGLKMKLQPVENTVASTEASTAGTARTRSLHGDQGEDTEAAGGSQAGRTISNAVPLGAGGGDADAAFVVLDDLLDDREAEAGALGFAGEEGLEDVLGLVGGDGEAGAVVGDDGAHAVAEAFEADGDAGGVGAAGRAAG
jgi:hypothetical protein